MTSLEFKTSVNSFLEQDYSPKGLLFEARCSDQTGWMFYNPTQITVMFSWGDSLYYIDKDAIWIKSNSDNLFWVEVDEEKLLPHLKIMVEQIKVLLNMFTKLLSTRISIIGYLERYDLMSMFGNLQDLYSLNDYAIDRIYEFEFYDRSVGGHRYKHAVTLKVLLQCADQMINQFDIDDFHSNYESFEYTDTNDERIDFTLGWILCEYLMEGMFPAHNYEGESFKVNGKSGLCGSLSLLYDVFDTADVNQTIVYLRNALQKELEPYIIF